MVELESIFNQTTNDTNSGQLSFLHVVRLDVEDTLFAAEEEKLLLAVNPSGGTVDSHRAVTKDLVETSSHDNLNE